MMNRCESIHETVIKDIVDLMGDVNDASKETRWLTRKPNRYQSLTREAANLTLVFPVLVSRDIDIKDATMAAKAIERKAVVLLQMLFASIQISDASNVKDYISRYHSNITSSTGGVDDFINAANKIAGMAESGQMFKITDQEVFNEFKRDLRNINTVIAEAISENSINDYKVSSRGVVLEKARPIPKKSTSSYGSDDQKTDELIIKMMDHDLKRDEYGLKKQDIAMKAAANKINARKTAYDMRNTGMNMINNSIMDSDVKKANELMPTTVIVNFTSVANDEPIAVDQGIIGVKAKLYIVEPMDVVERLSSKHVDNNWMRQFVRATTREISFWKDFVFAIDKAKIDAISSSKKGSSSKMWKVLERRATANKLTRWKKNQADTAPISTLVVSKEIVEYLKKDSSIDMENGKTAQQIMSSYNLMGFCILDAAAETASFLFDDGDTMFETLSYGALERESNDGGYKKVINLMTKLVR